MSGVTYELLVVYRAPIGTEQFTPVHRNDVPEMVQRPNVMARLADGDECDYDGMTYRAMKVPVGTGTQGVH